MFLVVGKISQVWDNMFFVVGKLSQVGTECFSANTSFPKLGRFVAKEILYLTPKKHGKPNFRSISRIKLEFYLSN